MSLITVDKTDHHDGEEHCRQLEQGNVLFFDHIPFEIPHNDLEFLLSARQDNTRLHKNISFRPGQNVLRGFSGGDKGDAERLREIMRGFSARATEFLGGFLKPYDGKWLLDYASFRPIEEAGRDLPLHKRNELLHVDAFPSRPTWGGRILRFFSNINPTESRIWEIGENFDDLARKHAAEAGLERYAKHSGTTVDRIASGAVRVLGRAGLPLPDRSAFDKFMLRFHDHLKEDADYQANSPKTRLEFPPNTSWIVYTDCVPHSVLSGQFALEQTYIVPFHALTAPEASPIRVLERECGLPLAAR